MALLVQARILPLYAQISISDSHATDYPVPEMGDEDVVASPQAVSVATRSDYPHGPLPVEVWTERLDTVWTERLDTDAHDLRLVYEGTLDLSDGRALVGNLVANDVHTFTLAPGTHRLLVFTVPAEQGAMAVRFLLDPVPSADAR